MPNLRRALPALAVAISLGGFGVAAGPAQAAAAHRYVNAWNIRPGHVAWIRSGPGVGYSKVGYLRAVSRHIRAIECRAIARDNWCHIQFQGTRGWVQDRFIRAPKILQG